MQRTLKLMKKNQGRTPKFRLSGQKAKKWREKDKKTLFEKVKERYLQCRKMKVNVVRLDPAKKRKNGATSQPTRKRSKKREDKQQQEQSMQIILSNTSSATRREGLRNKPSGPFTISIPNFAYQKAASVDEELKEEEDCPINLSARKSSFLNAEEQAAVETQEEVDEVEDTAVYYKLGNPTFNADAEWTITLSRHDFPWHEVAFEPFTPRECFEKYTSMVKDPQTFLRKVLGSKEKYRKMMEG